MAQLIKTDKSIIPSLDVSLDKAEKIFEQTGDLELVGAYKIGSALTGDAGYNAVVKTARKYTCKPLIFDGQKWGTDIPDTAQGILKPLKDSGIDAVILFPFSGPVTQIRWTETAQNLGLKVLIGGEMTHPGIRRDEGGYFTDEDFLKMYLLGVAQGVRDFVVPGNKADRIKFYRKMIESATADNVSYFSPGFVEQSGEISETGKIAGERFHAIVGRGIYRAKNPGRAVLDLTSKLP